MQCRYELDNHILTGDNIPHRAIDICVPVLQRSIPVTFQFVFGITPDIPVMMILIYSCASCDRIPWTNVIYGGKYNVQIRISDTGTLLAVYTG